MGGDRVVVIESKSQWDEVLARAGDKPVVVDFYAEWCGPCKMIGPLFVTLSEEFHDKLVFIQVNVDDVTEVAETCSITAMPTFQVWKAGKMDAEMVGASKEKLRALVEAAAK